MRRLILTALVSAGFLMLAGAPGEAVLVTNGYSVEKLLGSNAANASTSVEVLAATSDDDNLTVNFGLNVNADAGAFGTQIETGLGRFITDFTVTSSGNYDLTVRVHRVGALRRTDDFFLCQGSVSLGAMAAPNLTVNGESGPALSELALPGADIVAGTGNADQSVSEEVRSQTLTFRNRPGSDVMSLAFIMNAIAVSNSCEVSARLGALNHFTEDCSACNYPGDPARDQSADGLFVEVAVVDICGNGGSNPGEECDLANLNGTPGSCCTADCKFRASGEVCRAATGECDAAESCTGHDRGCPADLKQPAFTPCSSDGDRCTDDYCNQAGSCIHEFAMDLCRNEAGILDPSADNSTVQSNSSNDGDSSVQAEADVEAHTGINSTVLSRLRFNINADRPPVGEALLRTAQISHELRFRVYSPAPYSLVVSTALVGELRQRSDAAGCVGFADISGVAGESDRALSSGSLSLDDPGVLEVGPGDRSIDVLKDGVATIKVGPPRTSGFDSFVLRFAWEASVTSDSCEVAARFGAGGGSTTGCEICGYPGDPARDPSTDGHVVLVEFVPCDASTCPPTPTPTAPGAVQTPTPTSTPTAGAPLCDPVAYDEFFNVNGAGCTFCQLRNTTSCAVQCLPPAACACGDGPEKAQCCAANPCCQGCNEAGSLRCTFPSCSCNRPGCCETKCACAGDCSGDGMVTVDELITAVGIGLEQQLVGACFSLDADRNGAVEINEIVGAVNFALTDCP